MKRLVVLLVAASFAAAHAEEEYLGLYMGGNKIGYSSYLSHPETYDHQTVTRMDSVTVMDAGLLGAAMKMTVNETSWTSQQGKLLKVLYVQSSAGRSQKVVAVFGQRTAEIDIDSEGQKTHESLPIPEGAAIMDDPMQTVVGGKATPGKRTQVYVLDPTTVSFIKTDILVVGSRTANVGKKSVAGTLVQIIDPRMTMDVYVTAKGDLIKVEAPMGIEMLPETRETALSSKGTGYKPSADLAFTSSIRPNKDIANPETLTGLTLRITGHDLSGLPSDDHQTIRKDGAAWMVDVHPPKLDGDESRTISDVASQKPEWLRSSLDIPSDQPQFIRLGSEILKGESRVVPAALAVKAYVNHTMRPNAGIGVLRDASEVLRTKEGVCRDYAILTVTLMRAARIPARLVSGVVNWQGDFYYHAWAEIWDGTKWIGIDSTVPEKQMSAAHVKLAEGNVEGAFAFALLDKVKIEVLDARRN